MSLLAAGFLWVALLAVAGLVIAHLFSRSRPREIELPTARFVPEGAARAPTRARTPTDLMLLVLRGLVVVLVGTAFALPVMKASRRDVARVFAVDVSAHVSPDADARRAVLDSVGASWRDGDAIIAFDTAVRQVGQLDSLFVGGPGRAPGSLSAGLVGALRLAGDVAASADSIELVIVSPVHAGELDSATLAIRAGWPGRIRVIRSPGRAASGVRTPVELVASGDDPLRASVALAGGTVVTSVRVVRGVVRAADSAWVAAGDRVLVVWPASHSDTVTTTRVARPSGQPAGDSIGAAVAGGRVIVAAFERAEAPDDPAASPGSVRVVARWMDGRPAATEAVQGSGCIRTVRIPVPTAGDLAVRPEFVLFVRELLVPCGGRADLTPVSDETIAALRGNQRLAASSDVAVQRTGDSRLAGWLLVAALVLALLEQLVRRTAGAPGDPDARNERRSPTESRSAGAGA